MNTLYDRTPIDMFMNCMQIERPIIINYKKPLIINAWFNDKKGVTVVKWSDNTITKVTLQKGDVWDKEKGLALCYMKKVLGNNSSFNEILKSYIK